MRELNFTAKASDKVLHMEVYDSIGQDFFGEGITAQTVTDALKNKAHDSVTLHVNSPGGNAFEGVAIYNVLKAHGKPVNVKIDGVAASAASIIAMAGDTIEMGKGTMMMIHPAQMMTAGDAAQLRKDADVLDKVTGSMADIYAARTGQPKDAIVNMMNAETWMNPQDAKDKGFCTRCNDQQQFQAVASLSLLKQFKNVPTEITNRLGHTKKVDGENLTSADFIYVGDPERTDTWHLPYNFSTEEKTVSHLRDALSRFDQAGIPPTKKAAAWDKLVGLCKDHGVEVGADDEGATAELDDDFMIDIMKKRIAINREA